jgi:hypothetical protein
MPPATLALTLDAVIDDRAPVRITASSGTRELAILADLWGLTAACNVTTCV